MAELTGRWPGWQIGGDDGYVAGVQSAHQCAAAYARAASRFAAAAAQALRRLVAGQPAVMPQSAVLVPSDIVTMPQLHVPLVQMPVD
jgi:hypothetical protein